MPQETRSCFVARPEQELSARVSELASRVPALGSLCFGGDALSWRTRRLARPRHDRNGMHLVLVANRLLSEVGSDARLVPLSPDRRVGPDGGDGERRNVGQAYALATIAESIELFEERRLAIGDLADLVSYAAW